MAMMLSMSIVVIAAGKAFAVERTVNEIESRVVTVFVSKIFAFVIFTKSPRFRVVSPVPLKEIPLQGLLLL